MVDILCTKQAGAQLCQAQVKLEVLVKVRGGVIIKIRRKKI